LPAEPTTLDDHLNVMVALTGPSVRASTDATARSALRREKVV
jgi:hypothetical protein